MSEEKPRAQQMRLPHLSAVLGVLDVYCEALIDKPSRLVPALAAA